MLRRGTKSTDDGTTVSINPISSVIYFGDEGTAEDGKNSGQGSGVKESSGGTTAVMGKITNIAVTASKGINTYGTYNFSTKGYTINDSQTKTSIELSNDNGLSSTVYLYFIPSSDLTELQVTATIDGKQYKATVDAKHTSSFTAGYVYKATAVLSSNP